ncbi:MAG: ABC transporter permease [Acidimicrobiales bacterium]
MTKQAVPGAVRALDETGASSVSRASSEAESLGQQVRDARRRRTQRNHRRLTAIRLLSLVIVIAAWQIYGMHSIAILFAPITTVIHDGYLLFTKGQLASELGYSMWTFALGYAIGAVVGITVGMFMGAYRAAEAAVSMYVFALYATPMVALVPIISLWIGFDATAQVVVIALFVVWPMSVIVFHGVRNIDAELMEVGRSLRLNRRQTWSHLLLPGAVPFVITGATQGVAMGLVGMIIAEISMELSGIGRALETESQTYHTASALAVVLLIMILGVSLRSLLVLVERRLIPWLRVEHEAGRRA